MIVFKPDKQAQIANYTQNFAQTGIASTRILSGLSDCLKMVSIVWISGCVSPVVEHRPDFDFGNESISTEYSVENEELISHDKPVGQTTCSWQLRVDDHAKTPKK
jgi:hypothetical protein